MSTDICVFFRHAPECPHLPFQILTQMIKAVFCQFVILYQLLSIYPNTMYVRGIGGIANSGIRIIDRKHIDRPSL